MKYDDLPEVHSIHCCSGEIEIGMDGYLTAYEEEFDEESGRSYRTEKAHMSLQSFQCERLALIFEELGKRLKVGEDIARKKWDVERKRIKKEKASPKKSPAKKAKLKKPAKKK